MNHVLVDFRDELITIALRSKRLGRAALAVTASWTERFVTGLDISVALGQQNYDVPLTAALAATLPWDRKWLATFKGSQSHPIRRTMSMEHDEKAGFIALALAEGIHTCRTLPPRTKGRTDLVRRTARGSVEARAIKKGVSLLQADCCDKARDAYALNYQFANPFKLDFRHLNRRDLKGVGRLSLRARVGRPFAAAFVWQLPWIWPSLNLK